MDHHVGAEAVASPEIGGDVGVRRRGVRAVHDGEIVVSRTRGQLRQQHDIAQVHTWQRQLALFGRDIGARELAVERRDLRHPLGADRCGRPFGVLMCRNQFGVAVFQESGFGTSGIGIEHGSLTLDESFQLLGRCRQVLDAVTLSLHSDQQVVERRGDLHACRCQRVLSGAFVIVNGHPLLAVGFALQGDVAVYGLDECFQTFGDGVCLLQSLGVEAVAEERIRAYCAVDFGHDDALRQEAAVHSRLVVLPFIDRTVDVQGSEQRNVFLREIVHHIVSHASVSHVDDGRGTYRIRLTAPHRRLHVADAVDIVARLFQRGDQVFRLSHLPCEDNARGVLFHQTVLAQEGLVFGDAAEIRLLVFWIGRVGVVELLPLPFERGVGLFAVKGLAVDVATDEGKHVAVVAAPSAAEVAFDRGNGSGVGRNDIIVRVGGHRRDDGEPVIGGTLYGCALVGRDAQAHTVDQHHIVLAETVQLLRVERGEADAAVVVGFGDLAERDDLIVYKGDARGGEPDVPHRHARQDDEQGDSRPKDYLSFHIRCLYFFLNICSMSSDRPAEQVVPVVAGELL